MAEFILMPKLGFNMETGLITSWNKKEGDIVQKGDVIFEIETDKTTMEIESTVPGTLRKILAEEGETVPVVLPIAIIGEVNENIDSMVKEALSQLGKQEDSVSESLEVSNESGEASQEKLDTDIAEAPLSIDSSIRLKLSPRAYKYVQENKLDISSLEIEGTGFEGGVTAKDIENYVKNNKHKLTPLAEKIAAKNKLDGNSISGTGIGGKVTKADVERALGTTEVKESSPAAPVSPAATVSSTSPAVVANADGRKVLKTISYTGMRKVIGERLSQSKFTAPHLYFTTSVDVSKLMDLRKQVNEAQEQKISVNDFIIGAVIKALQKYPELNSSLQGDQILQYEDVNVGVAVGLETGLIVPVIKQAQSKKLSQISKESQVLIDKARSGKLLPDEYQGGTFTISNLGMFGIENFTAIINPPEAGILSISAVKKTPIVIQEDGEDKVLIRPLMNITLSVDHRIIDGLVATRFINEVKSLIESPFSIMI